MFLFKRKMAVIMFGLEPGGGGLLEVVSWFNLWLLLALRCASNFHREGVAVVFSSLRHHPRSDDSS
jgi:hypothetical protein